MRFLKALLLLVLCTGFAMPATAGRKVALVIGNADYVEQNVLSNPDNDARLIAKTLGSMGFELYGNGALLNVNLTRFGFAIREFAEYAKDADVALFYYAGHGSANGNVNYLYAVDHGAISSNDLMTQLEQSGARLKIVLLDACRTEAEVPRGLTQMVAPAGTIIGFAAQPGATASDGPPNSDSPYATALVRRMKQPGADHFTVLNQVGVDVANESRGEQLPWMHASPIREAFYFTPAVYANVGSDVLATATDAEVIPESYQLQEPIQPASQAFVSDGSAGSFIQDAWRQMSKGNYKAARKTLSEGLENDPNSALALSYTGFAWFTEANDIRHKYMMIEDEAERNQRLEALIKSHYAPAFLALDRAIELNSGYSSFYAHRGNAVIGVYHTRKALGLPTPGTLKRAIADLRTAVKTDPGSRLAIYDLGLAYYLAARYEDAIRNFKAALAISPTFVAPHDGLCRAYMKLGMLDEAAVEADLAARADMFEQKRCLRTEQATAE